MLSNSWLLVLKQDDGAILERNTEGGFGIFEKIIFETNAGHYSLQLQNHPIINPTLTVDFPDIFCTIYLD
jgi:hypothetical protein